MADLIIMTIYSIKIGYEGKTYGAYHRSDSIRDLNLNLMR